MIREDLQPAEDVVKYGSNHSSKTPSRGTRKIRFSAAGGAGFNNELVMVIASLAEQRALVLIEIPVLLIQPEAGILDEDTEFVAAVP